jgi:hypothetical protein
MGYPLGLMRLKRWRPRSRVSPARQKASEVCGKRTPSYQHEARMTSVNEQKMIEALAAAKRATSIKERDAHERAAIVAWRQIALDNGLDPVLLDRSMRDASKSELVKDAITREDLELYYPGDHAEGRAYMWAMLASYLNDVRVGFLRTKAGEAMIHAAKAVSEGRGAWLVEPVTKQGINASSEFKEAADYAAVGLAATYEAATGCGVRAALHYATTEYVVKVARLGVSIDAEALRRRVSSAGDRLAVHYRIMFRLMSDPKNRAAIVKANARIAASSATIRGKTSSSKK